MYKLAFFVPESHLEKVKAALFAVGAGRIGNYDQCCWQVLGQGQFRPRAGSQPFIGQVGVGEAGTKMAGDKVAGQLEQLAEYRVELVCDDELIKTAVAALRSAHPYEEPAIDVWRLADLAS